MHPDSPIRLDGNGVIRLLVAMSTRATLPIYHCPFCGVELQNRRTIERPSRP